MHVLRPCPRSTESEMLRWGPAIGMLTSPPGDSEACWSSGTTGLVCSVLFYLKLQIRLLNFTCPLCDIFHSTVSFFFFFFCHTMWQVGLACGIFVPQSEFELAFSAFGLRSQPGSIGEVLALPVSVFLAYL